MNILRKIKALPGQKNFLSIAIVTFLIITLPLFIWAIVTQRFNIGKRASTGEPGVCVPVGKTIKVSLDGPCRDIQSAVNAADSDGFTIEIAPGIYEVFSTIEVTGKQNISIMGSPQAGSKAVEIRFNTKGFGFHIQNSSGSITWMSMVGITPNGLMSIRDSNHFSVNYSHMYATGSHTFDSYNSTAIQLFNNEVQSSAGALEFGQITDLTVSNNKIHNSNNAISVNDSSNVRIFGNLIADNTENAIRTRNINGLFVEHNSIINNSLAGNTIPQIHMAGTISGNVEFRNNIIAHGRGPGVKVESSNFVMTWQRNDIWNAGENFVGMVNPVGTNGNISEDPRVNSSPGSNYCLMSGSPALYGDVAQSEYMGYIGSCSGEPSPTPGFTPRPPAGECQMCGGFAGIMCQTGFVCQMEEPGVPDQSGLCVRQTGGSNCYGTPSPSPSGSPSPTPTVPPKQTLSFLIKFAGVTDDSASGATVKVYIQTPENLVETPPVDTHYEGNGIYRATFSTSNRLADGRYPLYIKGEKHIRARFCNVNSKLTRCGGAAPATDGIVIDADGGTYDLTAYSLEPGDLFEQDGIADYRDFRKIITLMGKSTASLTERDLLTADLNYDGVINIRDAFMMRQSLSSRQDD